MGDVERRFVEGDVAAFEALFKAYQREVYGWIVRLVRDPAAAEDLTIETFWRIYRSRARFDPQRSFGAWARSIASNAAIDHLKTARYAARLPEQVAAPRRPDAAVQRELHDGIRRAFAALPAKLQVAATLALIEERSYEEICEALGISLAAVKSRIFRATRLLQAQLKRMNLEP